MGHPGIPQDPPGYRVEYADAPGTDDFLLIRLSDQSEVGRFSSREEAIKAADADG
jgi:hypothetical protein